MKTKKVQNRTLRRYVLCVPLFGLANLVLRLAWILVGGLGSRLSTAGLQLLDCLWEQSFDAAIGHFSAQPRVEGLR
jgi:hypothetical protein